MHNVNETNFTVMRVANLAPLVEGRYKLVNKLLAQTNIKQVLELAAGLAPRGLELTQDPTITSVELDLPSITREKRKIVDTILGENQRPNLNLIEGSALSKSDLMKATSMFKLGEIAVINEGLLKYLTYQEKVTVASNILSILKKRGGVWITPDVPTASMYEKLSARGEEMDAQLKNINRMTGVKAETNYFKDEADARAFFEGQGFIIEKHPLLEIFDQLNSYQNLSLSKESVRTLLEPRVVFVMKVR
jgi:O-methyltransferase involved in polyketide biosynthesis